jgi:phosphoribosylanthranilate isomerase
MVKICGITRLEDANDAVAAGATALGFVFWPGSPRYVAVDVAAAIRDALPADVLTVGVFVDAPGAEIAAVVERARLSVVQLHGSEAVAAAAGLRLPVIRSATLENFAARDAAWPPETIFLLDAADPVRHGGTGTAVDWPRAAALAHGARRVVLAGGLTPQNVADAVAQVRPYGVDVSSGVEAAPGVKDPRKVAAFVASARAAFEALASPGPHGGQVVKNVQIQDLTP